MKLFTQKPFVNFVIISIIIYMLYLLFFKRCKVPNIESMSQEKTNTSPPSVTVTTSSGEIIKIKQNRGAIMDVRNKRGEVGEDMYEYVDRRESPLNESSLGDFEKKTLRFLRRDIGRHYDLTIKKKIERKAKKQIPSGIMNLIWYLCKYIFKGDENSRCSNAFGNDIVIIKNYLENNDWGKKIIFPPGSTKNIREYFIDTEQFKLIPNIPIKKDLLLRDFLLGDEFTGDICSNLDETDKKLCLEKWAPSSKKVFFEIEKLINEWHMKEMEKMKQSLETKYKVGKTVTTQVKEGEGEGGFFDSLLGIFS